MSKYKSHVCWQLACVRSEKTNVGSVWLARALCRSTLTLPTKQATPQNTPPSPLQISTQINLGKKCTSDTLRCLLKASQAAWKPVIIYLRGLAVVSPEHYFISDTLKHRVCGLKGSTGCIDFFHTNPFARHEFEFIFAKSEG